MANISEIFREMPISPTKEEGDLIERAYEYAKEIHKDQKRHSGEDYFTHLFETAKNLARFGMDAESIAAGLLHDTIEDHDIPREEVAERFGEEILFLVEGVTKLGTLKYKGSKRHVESLRKLFIAMSEDIRVLIIKLVDRLHNMQTLEYLPDEAKQKRIASETLEIYAPLAHRLSIGALQRELQDLAFRYVYPKEYSEISKLIKERSKEQSRTLEKLSKSIKKLLAKNGIKIIKSDYRIKGVYSFYKKLKKYENIENIYDVMALRFIVPEISDCYRVLGLIHSKWKPLPGRIKDYIAAPKPNGYQSLHTTIFTGDKEIIEIQIRTKEMHDIAELGAASHFSYKEGGDQSYWITKILGSLGSFGNGTKKKNGKLEIKIPDWIKEMKEHQEGLEKPKEFIENLKRDFLGNRVFVFTPNGDVIDLPENSSPVDFAYAVHSDIGDHLSGAKVNGKLSSIETELKNGDIVEIITNKNSKPTRKWISVVKTSLAKRRIRQALGLRNK